MLKKLIFLTIFFNIWQTGKYFQFIYKKKIEKFVWKLIFHRIPMYKAYYIAYIYNFIYICNMHLYDISSDPEELDTADIFSEKIVYRCYNTY